MTNKDYIVKAMKVFEARLNEFEDTLKDLNL